MKRSSTEKVVITYLFGPHLNVVVECFGRAKVGIGTVGLARSACGQFALLENQRQQRKQGVSAMRKEVNPSIKWSINYLLINYSILFFSS